MFMRGDFIKKFGFRFRCIGAEFLEGFLRMLFGELIVELEVKGKMNLVNSIG